METNPYQPPQAEILVTSALSDAEGIRKAHIKHEASVKSVGSLYMLVGLMVLITGLNVFMITGNHGRNSFCWAHILALFSLSLRAPCLVSA